MGNKVKKNKKLVMPSEEQQKETIKCVGLFIDCANLNKIGRPAVIYACANIISGLAEDTGEDIEDVVKGLRSIHKKRMGNG